MWETQYDGIWLEVPYDVYDGFYDVYEAVYLDGVDITDWLNEKTIDKIVAQAYNEILQQRGNEEE